MTEPTPAPESVPEQPSHGHLMECELKADGLWLWIQMNDGVRVELTIPPNHPGFAGVDMRAARVAEEVIKWLPTTEEGGKFYIRGSP